MSKERKQIYRTLVLRNGPSKARRLAFPALALLLAACAGRGEVKQSPGGEHDPATPAQCNDARLPLLLQRDRTGLPIRAFVQAEYEGRTEVLLFDTGAARTHLTHGLGGPEVIRAAGTIRVGCASVTVESWGRRPVRGIEGHQLAIGTLGTDAILAGTTVLDLTAGTWVRYEEGAGPRDAEGWAVVPLEIVKGIPLVRVVVDGRQLRLMLDTGTSDVLLLDEHVVDDGHATVTTDTFGSRVELVRGTAMLSWPGMSPERVSVERTRSHPAFERHVRELGGGIDGILGLSALGSRRVLIEPKRQTMRLGPPSP
jgi:hypothetical protein